jgi:phosphoribosylformimino-5-aminoimidazole carboxamide ribotide isomerase
MQQTRSVFRPCIDLHNGQVKQIVGGTLSDNKPEELKTNFTTRHALSLISRVIFLNEKDTL